MVSGPATYLGARHPRVAERIAIISTRVMSALAISTAAALWLALGAAPAAADDMTPRSVKFFVDVTSTRLAKEVAGSDKRSFDLAGLPLTLGALRQKDGAPPSIAAGIRGDHDFKLGDHVDLAAQGSLSRIHTEGGAVLSDTRLGGDLALAFHDGGTRLTLQPAIAALLSDDRMDHVDYRLDMRLRQSLGEGWSLGLAAGQSWRVAEIVETESCQDAFARIGLGGDLFGIGRLDLGFEMTQSDGALAWQQRLSTGPVLAATLTPIAGWRFSGRYRLTETESGYDSEDDSARRHDLRHRLTIDGDWSLASSTGAGWQMKTSYDFERIETDGAQPLPPRHVASVSFALKF